MPLPNETPELPLVTSHPRRAICSGEFELELVRDNVASKPPLVDGALALRNVDGSFYDFEARLQRGTQSEVVAVPPDDWGGRALHAWASRLTGDPAFDPMAHEYTALAQVIDDIYALAA